MKTSPVMVLLSLLGTLTASAVLPEHEPVELIERDDAASISTNSTEVECVGCPPPPNVTRKGVCQFLLTTDFPFRCQLYAR